MQSKVNICRNATHSGELRLSPSWVRSCPMARLATSGLSLLTVANNPGRPNRSSALIWFIGVCSCVLASPGDSASLPL